METDRAIAVISTILLMILGLHTIILQVINTSYTEGKSIMKSFTIQPDIPATLEVLMLIGFFCVPAITAFVAAVKKTTLMRVIHMVILAVASASVLGILSQEMITLSGVNDNLSCSKSGSSESVDSNSLCMSRDTRIGSFVLMIFGFIILVINLIYTGIVFCASKEAKVTQGNPPANGPTN